MNHEISANIKDGESVAGQVAKALFAAGLGRFEAIKKTDMVNGFVTCKWKKGKAVCTIGFYDVDEAPQLEGFFGHETTFKALQAKPTKEQCEVAIDNAKLD